MNQNQVYAMEYVFHDGSTRMGDLVYEDAREAQESAKSVRQSVRNHPDGLMRDVRVVPMELLKRREK